MNYFGSSRGDMDSPGARGDVPTPGLFGERFGDVNAPGCGDIPGDVASCGDIPATTILGDVGSVGIGIMPTPGLFGKRFGDINTPDFQPTPFNEAMDSLFEHYSPGSIALLQTIRRIGENPASPWWLQVSAGLVGGLTLGQSAINISTGVQKDFFRA
jgi:hypothetical protein